MRYCAFLLLATCIAVTATTTRAADDVVAIKVGKLADLTKYIESNQGKIVIMDFWGDFCIPCKKEFPNLVRLHNQHVKDGLVCVSVSVDPIEDKDNALKFLKEKKATFFNILLDEEPDIWQTKWGFVAVPAVVVYGRDGKIAKKFTYDDPKNQFTYEDVEKFLKPLLEKK